MRFALDTNAYAEGVNAEEYRSAAKRVLAPYVQAEVLTPTQVLAELYWVLTRKMRRPAAEAQSRVAVWASLYPTIDTTADVLAQAMQLVVAHRIGFLDAIVLSSAASGGCDVLLSEDMQDGFNWRGVTVRDPFRDVPA